MAMPSATVSLNPLTQRLPGARMALALLLTINLFNYIDRQVLAAVESAIAVDFFGPHEGQPHASVPPGGLMGRLQDLLGEEARMGLLATAFMVTYMLVAPLFGWLADRMSRWLLIGIGVVLWSLASGASGLAGGFMALLLTRCLVGVGEGAYGPVAPTIISDIYPIKMRGYVLAWFYMAIPVGSALGYVLGGLMLKLTGDWRWAFYVVVPPGVLLGLWCFLMPNPTRGQADNAAGSRKAKLADYLILLRTPSFVLDTLGMTAMTFAIGGIAYWMPRYISRVRQAGELSDVSLIFGLIVVVSGLGATILGGITGDRLRDRFPGSYFLVSGVAMILAFPAILLVLFMPFPLAWVFLFLACFCLFFNTGPTNTILANVTHPSIRATAFAVNIFIIHAFGDAFSPFLIGLIKGWTSWEFSLGLMSVLVLIGGLLWLWGARYLQRDTELAPTRLG